MVATLLYYLNEVTSIPTMKHDNYDYLIVNK